MAKKKEGAGAVAARFNQVIAFKNAEWTMAALYRIGSMFHNFATSMETATCPPSFDEDTCDGFLEGLLEGSFELKDRAREHYEAVLRFGEDNGIVNAWTRRSLNGLNDIAPKEYPMFEGERQGVLSTTMSPLGLIKATEVMNDERDRDAPKDVELEEK